MRWQSIDWNLQSMRQRVIANRRRKGTSIPVAAINMLRDYSALLLFNHKLDEWELD